MATRDRILEFVAAHPGVIEAEIGRRLGVPRGTLRHHLEILLEEGKLKQVGIGRQWYYFLMDADPDQCGVVAHLAHRDAWRALAWIAQEPGIMKTDLARRLDVTRKAVGTPLSVLESAGLARGERRGRCIRYVVGPSFRPGLVAPKAPGDPTERANALPSSVADDVRGGHAAEL